MGRKGCAFRCDRGSTLNGGSAYAVDIQLDMAQLSTPSLANIALGEQKPSAQMLDKIYEASQLGGVEFTANEGVQKAIF